MYSAIDCCRICRNADLLSLLDLGTQALTGIFPKPGQAPVPRAPLELVKCHGRASCGLVQLRHTFDSTAMYGATYGYRSGLNRSMVEHLGEVVMHLQAIAPTRQGDVVLDIGSNDGTLLSFHDRAAKRVGIDPSGEKFRAFYESGIDIVVDFFSADAFLRASNGRKAKIVTSIAMFYDLPDPLSFMTEVAEVLDPEGIWCFEQSYLPSMLGATSYDTVCHEHLEYYALAQIVWMAERSNLKIIDVVFNEINGGSFAVTAARSDSSYREASERVASVLEQERALGLDQAAVFERFREDVQKHRTELNQTLDTLRRSGKKVLGYGASTKGNVLLQYCGIGPDVIPCVADVNAEKFGSTTATGIPIVSELDAREQHPDVFMVLPWHFANFIVAKEHEFLNQGGALLFPLPRIELLKR